MTDTCLVTGANGFIGRHLCERLQRDGRRVHALLRVPSPGPWDDCRPCDLASGEVPGDAFRGVDCCYHLASVVHAMPQSGIEDSLYETVNVKGSELLAHAAAAAGVRAFIYFSSVKAVADPGERCVDEGWEPMPNDPYGMSKREAERRLLAIGRETGMHVTVLRPTLVYGAGVKGNLLRMLGAIDRGRFPPLPDTHNRRSMVAVEDLVEAALLVARSVVADGEVYIVSDNSHYSTRQLSALMHAALGREPPRWHVPGVLLHVAARCGDLLERLPGQPLPLNSAVLQRLLGSACYTSDRLQRLGWKPSRQIADCLPDMVTAYRAG